MLRPFGTRTAVRELIDHDVDDIAPGGLVKKR
jgi:putative drug exporter of the RND superfamily